MGEYRTSQFNAPVESATAANVELSFSVGTATVQTVEDQSQLIAADISHIGEIDFRATGDRTKNVVFRQKETEVYPWTTWLAGQNRDQDYHWSVGLNPTVPMDLQVNGGVGDVKLDLQQVMLTGLRINGGAGDISIALPAAEQTYDAHINGGLGAMQVVIADQAAINLDVNSGAGEGDIVIGKDAQVAARINGGLGSYTIDVPDDAAVRITANGGIGGMNLPDSFTRISGQGRDGIWETPGFDRAEVTVTIDYNGGAGGLTVR
jgi:hypothetical protein